ncbi:MAG: hypothetical protein ACPHCN_02540, partial [Mycobacterium sp.]
MAVAWGPGHTGQHHSGQGHSGRRSRRNAGSLPVLRWLQVGAATAGLGVALVAAPAAVLARLRLLSRRWARRARTATSQRTLSLRRVLRRASA